MHQEKYVFAQLVSSLDNFKFRRIVQKYDGDKYVESFTCWNQLLVMMFAQLTKQDSLRTTSLTIESLGPMCFHLGFGKGVTRSNLSKANQERDCRIFEEFAYFVVNIAREKRVADIFKVDGNLQIDKSIYDALQFLDSNLTHRILLPELFVKSKIINFKDLIGPIELNLFNF